MAVTSIHQRGTSLAETILLTFAMLLLSRSKWVGAILLGAVCVVPSAAVAGIAAILLSIALAKVFRMPPEEVQNGSYSYNALLLGLGSSVLYPPSGAVLLVTTLAIGASVFLTAALTAAFSRQSRLPILTIPFLLSFYLLWSALPHGEPPALFALSQYFPFSLQQTPSEFLRCLGSLLFLARPEVGWFVFLALVVHSRSAAVLALLTYALTRSYLGFIPSSPEHSVASVISLNAILTAIPLAGYWFVPSISSHLLALGSALLTAVLTTAFTQQMDAPVLIVPFNATVLLVLYAMRQRTSDGTPNAVDFVPGTPEQNAAYFYTQKSRFGVQHNVRLQAPFRGQWTCTQSVGGAHTHQGPWRHALDFEVTDTNGSLHDGDGSKLEQYYSYRLPVLAPAAGTVVKIIDGIPDNAPGHMDTERNWGNSIILYHAPGVYSCISHLSPGSFTVREGQIVQAGAVLALCGNSGRSSTPHIHLQLQATAELGAPTIELQLADVVLSEQQHELVEQNCVPGESQQLRRLESDQARKEYLPFLPGKSFHARESRSGAASKELRVGVDLLGRYFLETAADKTVLYFEQGNDFFTVLDVVGEEGSVLQDFRLALSRVPFDGSPRLVWTDQVPVRQLLPWWLRIFFDACSPFVPSHTLTVRYTATSSEQGLFIEGKSVLTNSKGVPWLQTTATLLPSFGPRQISVKFFRTTRSHELTPFATIEKKQDTALPTYGAMIHATN